MSNIFKEFNQTNIDAYKKYKFFTKEEEFKLGDQKLIRYSDDTDYQRKIFKLINKYEIKEFESIDAFNQKLEEHYKENEKKKEIMDHNNKILYKAKITNVAVRKKLTKVVAIRRERDIN
jgi:hypothetical protein